MKEFDGFTRILNNSDLDSIADVHIQSFRESVLTKLGKEPIKKYYGSLLKRSDDNFNLGYFIKDQLSGFCFSGTYSGSLTSFIKQNKRFLFLWILFHPWLIFKKGVLTKVGISMNILRDRHKPLINISNFKEKSFGVLSIAVNPKYQNHGIGKKIMNEVSLAAKQKGYSFLHLTVHPTNHAAVKFYETNGWEKICNAESEWTGLMRKTIDGNSF